METADVRGGGFEDFEKTGIGPVIGFLDRLRIDLKLAGSEGYTVEFFGVFEEGAISRLTDIFYDVANTGFEFGRSLDAAGCDFLKPPIRFRGTVYERGGHVQ